MNVFLMNLFIVRVLYLFIMFWYDLLYFLGLSGTIIGLHKKCVTLANVRTK